MTRTVVIGAGIVGLAVGRALSERGHEVVVLEKEADVARHQTGRNSGVIHSGVYYTPGSLKARMCRAGARSMVRFAEAHGIEHRIVGKLIVATREEQRTRLVALAERAAQNDVDARLLTGDEAREYEPAVRAVAALRVESTGIIDYVGVSRALAASIVRNGGEIRLADAFVEAVFDGSGVRVVAQNSEIQADFLVNCAGLQSDRIALACGVTPGVRIVPFRGEYFELVPERRSLVNGLIYPVPDPRFPFLGVHLTKMIGGGVHAGPNAVLATKREGYRWRDFDATDLADSLAWPGLWRLGAKSVAPGAKELVRSLSVPIFAKSLAELVPGITASDLVRAPAGVRAQAIRRDGRLVDDFHIQQGDRQVHVLNAPSPAATSALEIAEKVAGLLKPAVR